MNMHMCDESPHSKIEAAKEAILMLLKHLHPDDRFGFVTFTETASVLQPLQRWEKLDQSKIATMVSGVTAGGGTDLSCGYCAAAKLMKAAKDEDTTHVASPPGKTAPTTTTPELPDEYRLIFFTDMQPNTGEISPEGLFGLAKANADIGIYSTFYGVGLDFDTTLTDHITTGIRGASYQSIKSAASFRKHLDRDFDYSVTPILFDLTLTAQPPERIKAIYGSEHDTASGGSGSGGGSVMRVGTLFPSAKEGGLTMGGVVLLKVAPPTPGAPPLLLVSRYVDRSGNSHEESLAVEVSGGTGDCFQNLGIRKAILLTRFVTLMRDHRTKKTEATLQALKTLVPHYESEMSLIGDKQLLKELTVLKGALPP
eukprot:TRINITY_DN926_c0_g3_i1.p1 TRINITY_DN926_c0_g3~~TRINITY_DN926_c0_g3_i1.p1  ORF type:complete len:368 (-),score=85.13 TRINITY_DN926_c0_g3_i1:88-1191(-)